MGINSVHFVADLVFVCYEIGFMMSFSNECKSNIIKSVIKTSIYLDDLLNVYFEHWVGKIYSA